MNESFDPGLPNPGQAGNPAMPTEERKSLSQRYEVGDRPPKNEVDEEDALLHVEHSLPDDVRLEYHHASNQEWYAVRTGYPTIPLKEYLAEREKQTDK